MGSFLPETEPLTAELRRLHLTVSRRLLSKIAAARDGLSHARPGATVEQVLEVALDLLLEKQARARRLVKQPVRASAADPATPPPGATRGHCAVPRGRGAGQAPPEEERAASPPSGPSPVRAARAVPAAVRREVWLRDGGRCQFPLDAGGVCGSTVRIELDHVVPVAQGGGSTVENLRLLCARHNRYAARLALGEAVMASARRRRRPGGGPGGPS